MTLAEAWNGTIWNLVESPSLSGSGFDAVACTAMNACTAVGGYDGTGYLTLAEAWNGAEWQQQTTVNPAPGRYAVLVGVSCVAASACTAVGSFQDGYGQPAILVEVGDWSTWTMPMVADPGDAGNDLAAVSCTAADACTAVGGFNGGSSATLAEVGNGIKWKQQTTPNPAGATSDALYGVSCTGVKVCTAVGNSFSSSDGSGPLAETE